MCRYNKNNKAYEDPYKNVELEQQFLLCLPAAATGSLRTSLQSETSNIKDRLGIEFMADMGKANV